MLRRILLPTIVFALGYGFWASSSFQDLAAGVALFLFGMLCMEQGFKAFSGGTLQRLLSASTDRLWKSLSFGVVSTTLMQSSSLVSVITISFLSAEMIGLAQGIGIIFGANLGTTTGAWIVAGFGLKVKISAYAMPLLVFGVLFLMQSSARIKGLGWILVGVGFLFLGIHFMKEGFASYAEQIDLARYAIPGVKGLLVFTLIGVVATVVMQSSHATLTPTIAALAAGQVTYENALALAIGANVGTTITALLGSLSANVSGKRLAVAHLVFNMVTGAVALVFIQPLLRAVEGISAAVGIAADDFTLKLAVFHTLFNVCSQALEQADMVLLSGGSSVGTRDFTIQVMENLPSASVLVHGIPISPGKPTILARAGKKMVWGLPGHVVSAMVVFSRVVKPFVRRLCGWETAAPEQVGVTARLRVTVRKSV